MKSLFEVLSMLNFILMPTWNHFASQNPLKINENLDPKRFPIMHPFSLLFWTPKTSLLGPNLEPSWLSVSPEDGPRGFPDSSRCAPELLPEGTQDGSQDEVIVKTPQDGFKVYFWWVFDRCLIDFLFILDRFIIDFGFYFSSVSLDFCILVDCPRGSQTPQDAPRSHSRRAPKTAPKTK